jgi:hypothetical protein
MMTAFFGKHSFKLEQARGVEDTDMNSLQSEDPPEDTEMDDLAQNKQQAGRPTASQEFRRKSDQEPVTWHRARVQNRRLQEQRKRRQLLELTGY